MNDCAFQYHWDRRKEKKNVHLLCLNTNTYISNIEFIGDIVFLQECVTMISRRPSIAAIPVSFSRLAFRFSIDSYCLPSLLGKLSAGHISAQSRTNEWIYALNILPINPNT